MSGVRPGVRLAVDVGRARVGLAASDPAGSLAFPVETLPRDERVVQRIAAEAAERDALEIVVGLPVSLSGGDTPSTTDAREVAAALAAAAPVPVRLVDERLSTVSAQSALRSAGRSTRRSRSVVDQAAAVIILQHALDSERAGGIPPGVIVEPD
ncbi:Holliday junction resolvase RuvX [Naasia sp. SYSU D00948]|uniref:Holliday junction resolvase RuvX n=1 Tax=Naasia sp. SYSU D00948 TaxID=2817379 RepID=UPI001B3147EF|nr:Holliday junction resolvase RuvX [Naasia sp. SYSU D00948]